MKPFYVGLTAFVEKNGSFLVFKSSADKDFVQNSWEPVTRRLEEKENPKDGILREIKEEASVEV
jgi:8-oxo-dGTP pyrophosphatase MutT (NUDIX family)